MNELIEKYFNVGVVQWMSHPPAQFELIDSIKRFARDDFFTAIEITTVEDDEAREKVRELLSQSHMRVGYGAQPILLKNKLNPNSLDESERAKAERALLEAIDEAHYLGAKSVAFLAGAWDEEKVNEHVSQLVKTTMAMCAHAETFNMSVELEVFDYDMDKRALIGPAPLARRYAEEVRMRYNNFGLLVDLSHFPTTYENSRFVIEVLKPYITHLHIGNAVVEKGKPAYGDLHPRFGYPHSANDVCELVDFFRILKSEGFFRENDHMILSIEVSPQDGEDAEIIIANTKRVINRAWSLA